MPPCACNAAKTARQAPFVVVLPGGREKSYQSPIAAQAEATRQGGYVKPHPTDDLNGELQKLIEKECVGANC